jgi:DNA-binding CsgD family transcriptional regulator
LSGGVSVPSEIYTLWEEIAAFPASRVDDALDHLMRWFQEHLDVDNVSWLGSLRMLDDPQAEEDPLLGWRLRASRKLLPDTKEYRDLVASYYAPVHYGKLTSTYYGGRHSGPGVNVHVGATSRALVEGAGKFRVHRLRDGWVDYAEFRQTEHFRLYYTNLGITDRIWIAFPVEQKTESIFLVDRHKREDGTLRKNFTGREAATVASVLRGLREFHRRLLLTNGVLRGSKALSPLKRRILQELLSSRAEKEIAAVLEQRPFTLRKYITELYSEFGVKTRAALMALWLGGD